MKREHIRAIIAALLAAGHPRKTQDIYDAADLSVFLDEAETLMSLSEYRVTASRAGWPGSSGFERMEEQK